MPRDNLSVSPLHVRFLHSVAVTQSLSLAFAYVTRYITTTADSGRLYPYILHGEAKNCATFIF